MRCTQPQPFSLAPCDSPEFLEQLEVKIETDRDHVAVVIELLVGDILIPGLDFFHPDVSVGPVNGEVLIEKEL